MDSLTQTQQDELHELLISQQKQLRDLHASSEAASKAVELDSAIGRLTRMDAMQQQQMARAERRRRDVRLQQISAALAAIAEERYGDCKKCEDPIGYPRLNARPESPFCVPCMNEFERR